MAILNHGDTTAASGTSPAAAAVNVAPPMHSLVQPVLDADEFRRQGRLVVDFIADYYTRIDEYPVRPAVAPGFLARQLPEAAPARPEPCRPKIRRVGPTEHTPGGSLATPQKLAQEVRDSPHFYIGSTLPPQPMWD